MSALDALAAFEVKVTTMYVQRAFTYNLCNQHFEYQQGFVKLLSGCPAQLGPSLVELYTILFTSCFAFAPLLYQITFEEVEMPKRGVENIETLFEETEPKKALKTGKSLSFLTHFQDLSQRWGAEASAVGG